MDKGATWSEMMKTINDAYEQHLKGEWPDIIPKEAEFANGVYKWETENTSWSWRPGFPMFSAWSKDIYVSSRMPPEENGDKEKK